jgi:hypothetical protein
MLLQRTVDLRTTRRRASLKLQPSFQRDLREISFRAWTKGRWYSFSWHFFAEWIEIVRLQDYASWLGLGIKQFTCANVSSSKSSRLLGCRSQASLTRLHLKHLGEHLRIPIDPANSNTNRTLVYVEGNASMDSFQDADGKNRSALNIVQSMWNPNHLHNPIVHH